jgi:hypothetical protein
MVSIIMPYFQKKCPDFWKYPQYGGRRRAEME